LLELHCHPYCNHEISRTDNKVLECGDLSLLLLLWRLVAKAGPRSSGLASKRDAARAFDGDKSPAESADKSVHSKAAAGSPCWVYPCSSVVQLLFLSSKLKAQKKLQRQNLKEPPNCSRPLGEVLGTWNFAHSFEL